MTTKLTTAIILASALLLTAGCQAQSDDQDSEQVLKSTQHEMTVYHDPQCGCCGKWVEHMQANGFDVEEVPTTDMGRVKREHGVPRELPSCHTAVVGDYVIEGHVPAEDVLRLLAEQPNARGLSVPGMPLGSPGMEVDHRRMAYDVVLFKGDGETEVFNHYEAIE
ncbi:MULTISPECIES: DUF411 domain-containing protein [unclassified Wenzhouxiangella]|uniref:DUF411 domain-containing protein n=1 Tax=unclassified Wenzhouxiangella TaxID=2613841 RepID=UPI000E32B7E7|nr:MULTISPECIES: DUF411 domain-containing protein [unclassified Wenzhouxiangella]RFF28024.1 DUF411 domain-containing protein [Wenzhouxiangella sp. 15181]RFP68610.1 DUF411 domain-containing protein [Wenzhouxiangella sp. 15190]